ncbi:hypothetical protein Patl1_29429 [Pistacia atlantica]|uniref:Uncharacterized protein n=1 Tax=Pistacia atlantica TaxID=434234 RepID=A0ACC1A9P9_9ROSI|nr:hypothetical protein Patl1_29429 [Pistacia atlantica]
MASKALSRLSSLQNHLNPKGLVKLSDEVSDALSSGQAVVALESNHYFPWYSLSLFFFFCFYHFPLVFPNGVTCEMFYSLVYFDEYDGFHGFACISCCCSGMPYPQNLETAKEVEEIVRDNGAVPATIAILDGVPCIGLSIEELERLAKVATRGNGATTVSATMYFASMVGIPVFVTGGIGGVHRHGEKTLDISSDLTELGRTPVAVISAGVKSILDIPRTLEYLETQGVCVAAYKTHEFPAFFTETSGCKVPCRVDSPQDYANQKLKLGSGILIAVPIPKEHTASGNLIESAIQSALREARDKKITGNAETPFLLARVNELTGGVSLASNIALVKNNAFVGAKIAAALSQLRQHCS